ncbi:M4 family metallopeptidase [Halobacillus shinanisalinarum]|uniref:Neutral metalloproteinase n=1 Tax=Halobacillus shinanisalinarum TaxID=2932258 RepID=A0ABY4H418_9BACI|nr:M4 family metallopeptidase [Halobacillus shinanisalinarum]UOQ94655.1 M4 family metallopeptidase [Halobacillus shinanisalinarum]
MNKKIVSSTLALSLALGGFASLGTTAYADEKKVEFNEKYNTPSYIIGNWQAPQPKSLTKTEPLSEEEVALAFMKANGKLFKLKGDMKQHFKVVKQKASKKNGTHHLRLVEQYKDIPIYGSDQTITLDENNHVTSFFGQVVPNLDEKKIPTEPSISDDEAVEITKQAIDKKIGHVENYDGDISSKLYIFEHEGEFHLTYLVKASTSEPEPGYWHYFIDATNGNVIQMVNEIDHVTGFGKGVLGNKQMFEVTKGDEGNYFLFDGTRGEGVHTFHAQHIDPLIFNLLSQLTDYTGEELTSDHKYFSDSAAVSAQVNAADVYDYYKETFGRDSYDDQGAKLISSVHVGENWNNAAWNGKQMMYGDGDGETFISLSGAKDVIAHELTHAVTDTTSDLVYENESGALNESISDILGVMVDREDWKIGEDVYTPEIEGDALRTLKDPASATNALTGPYPDHYSKKYTGEEDNGGVHINSSINNKAAYLISEGGTHYGVTVEGVGREATEQIYYLANTQYLTASSDFSMMRQAAIEAATAIYGESSAEVEAVKKAYKAVGVQ